MGERKGGRKALRGLLTLRVPTILGEAKKNFASFFWEHTFFWVGDWYFLRRASIFPFQTCCLRSRRHYVSCGCEGRRRHCCALFWRLRQVPPPEEKKTFSLPFLTRRLQFPPSNVRVEKTCQSTESDFFLLWKRTKLFKEIYSL